MSTLGSSARRCNSEDNLASLLALPNDKRLTVARLRALGELNRLCSTSLLHCDTDLVWQPNLCPPKAPEPRPHVETDKKNSTVHSNYLQATTFT